MVEFISESAAVEAEEPPPASEPEESSAVETTLEALVEEHTSELQEIQAETDYVDEAVPAQAEYNPPQEMELKDAPSLKEELKPLIYEDNERVFIVDIFERYGKKEDKWWKQLSSE